MARVTLRLPDELHKRLCEASRKRGISLNRAIIETLRSAADPSGPVDLDGMTLEAQVQHLRTVAEALSGEIRPEDFPPELLSQKSPAERARALRSLPRLDPPLSQTLIEEREDRI